MLSGIGPAQDLTRLGISVRGDLPVGVGLQDHPMAWLSWRTETESLLTAATPENHALLQNEGRGPLSSNGAEAGGFVRTRAGLPAPDIQFHAVPAIVYDDYQDMSPGYGTWNVLEPLRAQTAQPRQSCAPKREPLFQTGDSAQLLRRTRGPPEHD